MDEVRLIDAIKLESEILDWQSSTTSKAQYDAYENALNEIYDAPTIRLPVARWKLSYSYWGDENYTCTNCKQTLVLEDGTPEENEYRFCPFCGANIEGIDRAEAEE